MTLFFCIVHNTIFVDNTW